MAIGRGELHHITHVISFVRVAHVAQHFARQPLLHVGVALAKSGACGQLECGACALFHVHQAGFHRGGQFPRAQAQRGGLAGEGVDDVPSRAAQAVVQGEERARLDAGGRGGHKSPDKLPSIVESLPRPAFRPLLHPHAMPLKDLPLDARPREKLLARGPGALSDAELLAILLRTGIAGKGVLQMADELLQLKNHSTPRNTDEGQGGFGGIAGLLSATADDLKRVKGLGPAKRAEIVAVLELARRAMAQRLQEREVFADPQAVKHYLQLHLAAKGHEVFAVLFLDTQNKLLAMEELFRGTLTQTSVYPREVVIRALHHSAAAVVLAHNHPSGTVQPSRADEALTQTLKAALALVDVRVLDHIIVGPGQALSMAEAGLL